jgi:hypothetical protein
MEPASRLLTRETIAAGWSFAETQLICREFWVSFLDPARRATAVSYLKSYYALLMK